MASILLMPHYEEMILLSCFHRLIAAHVFLFY